MTQNWKAKVWTWSNGFLIKRLHVRSETLCFRIWSRISTTISNQLPPPTPLFPNSTGGAVYLLQVHCTKDPGVLVDCLHNLQSKINTTVTKDACFLQKAPSPHVFFPCNLQWYVLHSNIACRLGRLPSSVKSQVVTIRCVSICNTSAIQTGWIVFIFFCFKLGDNR